MTRNNYWEDLAVYGRKRGGSVDNLPLFSDTPAEPEPEPLTIQQRFEAFDAENPHIYAALQDVVFDMRRSGLPRWSVKAAFEVLRYQSVKSNGEDFKLPNDFTSRYARKLLSEFPQLEGFIETRELKSE